MKPIKLLFITVGFLLCANIYAEEITITFTYRRNIEDRAKDNRSISLETTAFLNENTLCIYTNLPVENLQIAITDSYNNPVYSNNGTACSRSHTFELNTLPKGEYIVELIIGDDFFYGYFTVQ